MGFFSDLSDTDDSAIDEIISQAKDACVLEQVSAINCSSFTDDSLLPTHLETRFRKLKSFPAATTTTPPPRNSKAENFSKPSSRSFHYPPKGHHQSPHFSPPKEESPKLQRRCVSPPSDSMDSSHGKNGLKSKSKLGSVSPGSGYGSSHGSEESSLSSVFKPAKNDEGKGNKVKVKPDSVSTSLSPPRRAGCFWCSPKKDSRKKSKEIDWGILGWDKTSDELLSDLGSFSSKKQQKMLKKAMKEEQKISREAEKIVEWAKQASARMNVSVSDDELSDKD